MSLGFWQIALIVILFLLLFGRGKIPQLMSDMAQGIKSFKEGVGDDNKNGDAAQADKALRRDNGDRAAGTNTEQQSAEQHSVKST